MSDDRIRELLALRLYGEINGAEQRAVDAALAASPELQLFAADLESGLGSLIDTQPTPAELPEGWSQALRRETTDLGRAPSWPRYIRLAASFAAGVLVTWSLAGDDSPIRDQPATSGQAEVQSFGLNEPPPRASSRGRLSSYLRR